MRQVAAERAEDALWRQFELDLSRAENDEVEELVRQFVGVDVELSNSDAGIHSRVDDDAAMLARWEAESRR